MLLLELITIPVTKYKCEFYFKLAFNIFSIVNFNEKVTKLYAFMSKEIIAKKVCKMFLCTGLKKTVCSSY